MVWSSRRVVTAYSGLLGCYTVSNWKRVTDILKALLSFERSVAIYHKSWIFSVSTLSLSVSVKSGSGLEQLYKTALCMQLFAVTLTFIEPCLHGILLSFSPEKEKTNLVFRE